MKQTNQQKCDSFIGTLTRRRLWFVCHFIHKMMQPTLRVETVLMRKLVVQIGLFDSCWTTDTDQSSG